MIDLHIVVEGLFKNVSSQCLFVLLAFPVHRNVMRYNKAEKADDTKAERQSCDSPHVAICFSTGLLMASHNRLSPVHRLTNVIEQQAFKYMWLELGG